MEKLKANPPSLFVVDECAGPPSTDRRLGASSGATARRPTGLREDIIQRLGMRQRDEVVVWGFDRPNIWIGVEACPDEATSTACSLQRVKDEAKPVIVYVATQAHAEELAADLAAGKGSRPPSTTAG